jgi:transcription termination factor Rho
VARPEAPVDDDPVVPLEAVELTILTCWAEAVGEALATSPDQLNTILDVARAGAPWRRQLGVAEPSAVLASALEELAVTVASGTPTVDAMLAAMDERPRDGDYSQVVRAVLRSQLERPAPAL